jgi:glyoxylase-like metal-dependent hydrolase (beta-lactamase superfamily II)
MSPSEQALDEGAAIEPIVARERELAALEAFVDGLARGPSALLLAGGHGIGKTTIWRSGVALARSRAGPVLVARPSERVSVVERASARVGTIELRLIRDGVDRVPGGLLFEGAEQEELGALLAGRLDDGEVPVTYDGLLIRSGSRLVLVDAGSGELAEAGAGGDLVATLRGIGVAPEDIDVVVVTHGHADHVGGLVRTDGGRLVPVFGGARHVMSGAEWRFWASAEPAGISAELASAARRCIPPLGSAGLLDLVDGAVGVAAGVRVVPAPGHTPGHAIVEIASAGEGALFLGDAVFHPLSFERPEWPCAFDADGSAAVDARRGLIERAARDDGLVMASHLGSIGRVERHRDRFRFVPVT